MTTIIWFIITSRRVSWEHVKSRLSQPVSWVGTDLIPAEIWLWLFDFLQCPCLKVSKFKKQERSLLFMSKILAAFDFDKHSTICPIKGPSDSWSEKYLKVWNAWEQQSYLTTGVDKTQFSLFCFWISICV